MSAVYLAESRKTSGRWVYSGRMVRRNDEPKQLLFSAFSSTPSSASSKMSVRIWHDLLPFLGAPALLI